MMNERQFPLSAALYAGERGLGAEVRESTQAGKMARGSR